MAITIVEATLHAQSSFTGNWASTSSFGHIPENDKTFDCSAIPIGDTSSIGLGVLQALASISATPYFGSFEGEILTFTGSITGTYVPGFTGTGLLTFTGSLAGDFLQAYSRNNLVGWSKIGDTRLLLDESNEAGYKHLAGNSAGLIYRILQLEDKHPIVYGSSGITLMAPVTSPFATFGFKKISDVGILGPGSVCGDDAKHYFINKNKELCMLEAGDAKAVVLGFAEYIEAISPGNEIVMMFYDALNERVYISSSVGGLILTKSGMGGGFANLTAADGVIFASDGALASVSQEICTDVIDMKTRGIKTIQEVLVGTALTQNLLVAIDTRFDKASAFVTSPWVSTNTEGVAFPMVSGIEFRIRAKTAAYEDFEIDYISLRFKFSDKRFNRGSRSAT